MIWILALAALVLVLALAALRHLLEKMAEESAARWLGRR